MDIEDERIREVVNHTEILRLPKQNLATFGTTNLYYYLVTEPVYANTGDAIAETVVREGRVIAERPRIVTPYYLTRLEGFSSDARRYFELILKAYGSNAPGIYYTYRNEPKETNIIANDLLSVVDKINADIDKRGDQLASIIKGRDELWDVSLMKFIYEMTRSSLRNNLSQMDRRGLLDVDAGGTPIDARLSIEELFQQVTRGEREPRELKEELDRWDLFEEYEDRFFNIFGKPR
jgi:hypothetical protein